MTQKILDTCCVISFFKDVTACDMLSLCRDYTMTIPDHVLSELIRPIQSIRSLNVIQLNTVDKRDLFREVSNTFPSLGKGEISAFVLSVCLNELGKEQTVFVTDDKRAIQKLNRFRKQREVIDRFPNIGNVLIVRSKDVIVHLFDRGKIDRTSCDRILSELSM